MILGGGVITCALGALTSGVILFSGATQGSSEEAALAADPRALTTICGYTTPTATTPSNGPALTRQEQAQVSSWTVAAAYQGLDRNELIDQLTYSLTESRRSAGQADGRSTRNQLRKVVAAHVQRQAAHLCSQLTSSGEPESPVKIVGSGGGAVAVKAAMRWLGTSYSWGGGGVGGPSYGIGRGAGTKGFDCSGLTEYAWAKAGVRIGSTTSPQWRSGKRIPRGQLQPGDLLFFAHDPRNPATIHHVGLNIDGKRMIHSPRTGGHVEVVKWAGNSYREREFIGAVRPG